MTGWWSVVKKRSSICHNRGNGKLPWHWRGCRDRRALAYYYWRALACTIPSPIILYRDITWVVSTFLWRTGIHLPISRNEQVDRYISLMDCIFTKDSIDTIMVRLQIISNDKYHGSIRAFLCLPKAGLGTGRFFEVFSPGGSGVFFSASTCL
jgi:hypothetical protein